MTINQFAPVYGYRGGPSSRPRFGWDRAPSYGGFGAIVTPGTSTYPSQDGTFTIVRGSGQHYGNGLIDGWLIAGTQADGNYALDDNNTGSIVDANTVGRSYKVGSELQKFLDDTPNSPEYKAWLVTQRQQDEAANPKLKAYDDSLRAWAQSQQPPVSVDPLYGFATNFDMSQAPAAVQNAYADFTGHPIPQAPPPPPGPNIYLVGGLTFEDDGTVLDGQTHQPTGQKLTPDQVHSLLTTGALPASSGPPASSPTQTAPASQPASSPPPASSAAQPSSPPSSGGGATLGDQLNAANPSPGSPVSSMPVSSGGGAFAPSGAAVDLTPSGAPATLAPSSAGSTGAVGGFPLWGWLALGGGALLLLSSRRKGRR